MCFSFYLYCSLYKMHETGRGKKERNFPKQVIPPLAALVVPCRNVHFCLLLLDRLKKLLLYTWKKWKLMRIQEEYFLMGTQTLVFRTCSCQTSWPVIQTFSTLASIWTVASILARQKRVHSSNTRLLRSTQSIRSTLIMAGVLLNYIPLSCITFIYRLCW